MQSSDCARKPGILDRSTSTVSDDRPKESQRSNRSTAPLVVLKPIASGPPVKACTIGRLRRVCQAYCGVGRSAIGTLRRVWSPSVSILSATSGTAQSADFALQLPLATRSVRLVRSTAQSVLCACCGLRIGVDFASYKLYGAIGRFRYKSQVSRLRAQSVDFVASRR